MPQPFLASLHSERAGAEGEGHTGYVCDVAWIACQASSSADGTALLTASTATPELEPEWECFEPTAEAGGELELRVPYRGYTDALEETFLDGGRAWEVARRVGYRLTSDASGTAPQQPSTVSSPYAEMLAYAMPPGARIDGLQAGMVTSKLRTVVMGKVGDAAGGQLPAAVSGHGADTIPHVAYLPLLDVAHPHARGHLMGVGVALPAGQPATRAAVLRNLRPGQPLTLRLPFGELSLQPASERLAAMADPTHSRLSPTYWMQRSRRWASVTPLVLDRFPRRPTDIAEEVAKACTRVGLPEPEDVVVGAGPMVRGGAALHAEGANADPVYGEPRTATWQWLTDLVPPRIWKTERSATAGFTELRELPGLDVSPLALRRLGPPTGTSSEPRAAPILFPQHLEGWVRTGPVPIPDAPVAPFLHGFDDRRPAVRVIWRADLTEPGPDEEVDRQAWAEVVATVPPRAEEELELPLATVRAWLRRQPPVPLADDEIPIIGDDDGKRTDRQHQRPALRIGRRRDEPEIVQPRQLRPDNRIVVPTAYGGLDEFGWAPTSTAATLDIADVVTRQRPVIRLNRDTLLPVVRHVMDKDAPSRSRRCSTPSTMRSRTTRPWMTFPGRYPRSALAKRTR